MAPAFRADDYAFSNRHRRLGGDHRDTLRSATHLASDLRALGRYEQARQLDEETLTRRRRTLGDDHPETLRSATNLASDLRALGQLEQARQLDQETVTHRQGADLPAATVAVDQHEVYLA